MKLLRYLIDFYIQSSLHVGLAVVCLVFVTLFSNDLVKHLTFPFCVFFGTILGYNFLRYFETFLKGNFHTKSNYGILAISAFAVIGFLYYFLRLNLTIKIHILITGLFVLMYPFFRKQGWLKMFLVSFVVTFVTVYIPFRFIENSPLDFYVNLLQRFLILVSLLIPFEIMDSKTDPQSLNTLPQLFGIKKTKVFGILLVIPFMVLEFLKQNTSYLVLPIGIITILCINFTTLERDKYYTSFWVESVPIFWLGLLMLFQ